MKKMKVGEGKNLSRKNRREAEQESGLREQAKEWSLFARCELERIENYQDNPSDDSSNFHMYLGTHTILHGLGQLNEAEVRAYCEYFQLSLEQNETKQDRLIKIRNVFQINPEYLLYIFNRDELECLLRCYNNVKAQTRLDTRDIYRNELGLQKAILLGLLKLQTSYFGDKLVVCLYFAEDAECVLQAFTTSLKKKYWARTSKMSKMLGYILKTYGTMEIDEIYKVYCRYGSNHLPEQEFKIFLYLQGKFNMLYELGVNELGEHYVYLDELDHQAILEDRTHYAKGLEYRVFDYEEIKEDSDLYSDFWIEVLDEFLIYHMNLEKESAHDIVTEIYVNIKHGDCIERVFAKLKIRIPQWNHYAGCRLWVMVLSLIKEASIFILKGYSRDILANMRQESWWDYKIVEQDYLYSNQDKDKPLYEFPSDIQAKIYCASEYDSMEYAGELYEYMVANQVQSEEYIYLLAFAYASNSEYKRAEKMVQQLRKSSPEGERLAERVEVRIQSCLDIDDVHESTIKKPTNEMMLNHMLDMEYGAYNKAMFQQTTPYVREDAKIGRNDQCPCGSGKKYKKCCGRNN
ncbi:MAG: SEC-C metal-binding domain-containing protein [Eubacteriales bacterium]